MAHLVLQKHMEHVERAVPAPGPTSSNPTRSSMALTVELSRCPCMCLIASLLMRQGSARLGGVLRSGFSDDDGKLEPEGRPLQIVMLVRNSVRFDTRVKKEAQTLAAEGFRVTVVGIAKRGLPDFEQLGSVAIERMPAPAATAQLRRLLRRHLGDAETRLLERRKTHRLTPLTTLRLRVVKYVYTTAISNVRRVPKWVRRILKEHWAYSVVVERTLRRLDPDIIHAHDLGTLHAATRYCLGGRAKLVYDAHELELARRPKLNIVARLVDRRVERAGARFAAAVITVSEGIASSLARRYRVERPAVVLNSPSLQARAVPAALNLREAAGVERDDVLAIYEGKVLLDKVGLEQLIRALALLPPRFHVGLLGPPAASRVRAALEALVRELEVEERLHWLGFVPYEEVPAALSTATCSVIPIQNVHRSYDLALPNKLFDAVMAGIPVGVGRLHEMQRVVSTHQIGVVFDERQPQEIATALMRLEELAVDQSGELAERLSRLQAEISWERQEETLRRIYQDLAAAAESGRVSAART
jgi:glycogen(starch) synthase